MEKKIRRLPIGIQSFEQLIEDHYLYVDKTEYIYRMILEGKPYFLSRPRRFGKSLLLSTLKAYWEGRKDLFEGLKIEQLAKDNPEAWQPHPVFFMDFNRANFQEEGALEKVLEAHLREWESQYGATDRDDPLGTRFGQLLRAAYRQTGKRCAVLVDEYDKSLLESRKNPLLLERNKAVFKGFFSALKSDDAAIRFILITGVTKFSKISIFSDLNQLRDISMNAEYAAVCGITEAEMKMNFMPEIQALAEGRRLSTEACIDRLRKTYDGYRFSPEGEGTYNPFSLLNAFADKSFDAYWFETGTPTFLVNRLKEMRFDIKKMSDGTLYATKQALKDYRDDNPDPVPLMYQTGYLTIAAYDEEADTYTLTFPNEEVKYSFLNNLLPTYVKSDFDPAGTVCQM